MKELSILSLPEEIQVLVVELVAANSFADLYRLKTTCKSMKALTELPTVYASFDVFNFPWYVHTPHLLLRTLYAAGNPSALYIKGVQFFFTFGLQEEGLALMKRAADAGFERALYTYAMTCKIFWDDEEYFSRLTRKNVDMIGRVVRSLNWGRGMSHNIAFVTKRDEFISSVIPLFYSCECTPCLDRDWYLWHIENSKDQKKNGYVRVLPHSEKKGNAKVQFSSPETGDGNVRKRKTE
ncbi:BnaA02g22090D [Brassica napus]|uniref:BnaA02g22090D protein n=1 Tax=Brassica napus TaxID=3708 RepID=A0A078GJ72_BRANA|nr:BnaA02g22090D [Brassica napus]